MNFHDGVASASMLTEMVIKTIQPIMEYLFAKVTLPFGKYVLQSVWLDL